MNILTLTSFKKIPAQLHIPNYRPKTSIVSDKLSFTFSHTKAKRKKLDRFKTQRISVFFHIRVGRILEELRRSGKKGESLQMLNSLIM